MSGRRASKRRRGRRRRGSSVESQMQEAAQQEAKRMLEVPLVGGPGGIHYTTESQEKGSFLWEVLSVSSTTGAHVLANRLVPYLQETGVLPPPRSEFGVSLAVGGQPAAKQLTEAVQMAWLHHAKHTGLYCDMQWHLLANYGHPGSEHEGKLVRLYFMLIPAHYSEVKTLGKPLSLWAKEHVVPVLQWTIEEGLAISEAPT